MVLADGKLVAYIERGARSIITWSDNEAEIVSGVVAAVKRRRRPSTVATVNGEPALKSPLAAAMAEAGFVTGYKGLVYRPRR